MHEGFIVAFVCAVLSLPPIVVNLMHTSEEHANSIFYSKTSLFAGSPLTWVHVGCDLLYTALVAAYCVRWQRQLLVSEARPGHVQSLSEVIEACSIVVLDEDPPARGAAEGPASEATASEARGAQAGLSAIFLCAFARERSRQQGARPQA